MKTIIERGASWTLEETKLLLRLWGKDLVERQSSGAKRTKEVYERIADKFMEIGHERTADQVRTRIFNMIAEYRRILKDNNPERERKCIFFAALHKIYQARHMDDVKSALDDYEPDYPYSPGSVTILEIDEYSDSDATDGNESINHSTIANASSNLTATSNDITINTTNSSKNNVKADSKDGDSNNNNNEKGSSGNASHHHHQQQGASASAPTKRIKLDSPKASNQLNQSATTSSSTQNSHPEHANTNSKQNKTSSTISSVTQSASTSNSAGLAPATPSSSSLPTLAAASTSSIASSSAQRHQSLLLPHATATSSSSSSTTPTTPINKLTTSGTTNAPSYININSTKLPIIRTNQLIGHSNGNESINSNGTTTRLPTTAAITSHQLYQAPVNTFDVTSSALLIDRMFAHLSRESENMREWIALEKERLANERTRRQQETEREVRRERVLIDTLMRFQEQWLSFLTRLDPRIIENSNEQPPELRIPTKEASTTETSQSSAVNSASSTNNPETSKQ